MHTIIKCYFCRSEVETVKAAIDAGWVPEFYDSPESCHVTGELVCKACVGKFLRLDEGGEYQKKSKEEIAAILKSEETSTS